MSVKEGDPRLAPKWSTSMHITDRGKVDPHYMDGRGGQRVIGNYINEEGVTKQASVPHLPYEYMIDSTGQSTAVAVGSSRVRNSADITIKFRKLRTLLKAGWIPQYWELANELGATNGVSADKWDAHVVEQAAIKRKRHNEQCAKFAKSQMMGRVLNDPEAFMEAVKAGRVLGAKEKKGK